MIVPVSDPQLVFRPLLIAGKILPLRASKSISRGQGRRNGSEPGAQAESLQCISARIVSVPSPGPRRRRWCRCATTGTRTCRSGERSRPAGRRTTKRRAVQAAARSTRRLGAIAMIGASPGRASLPLFQIARVIEDQGRGMGADGADGLPVMPASFQVVVLRQRRAVEIVGLRARELAVGEGREVPRSRARRCAAGEGP